MVTELTAEGSSTREIAEVLGTSLTTIENDLRGNNLPDNPEKDGEIGNNLPLDAIAVLTASDKVKADALAKLHTGDEESYTPIKYLDSGRKASGANCSLNPFEIRACHLAGRLRRPDVPSAS